VEWRRRRIQRRVREIYLLVSFVLEMDRSLSVPGQSLNGRKTTKGQNREDQTADIQRGKRLRLSICLNTLLAVVDTDDMKADRWLHCPHCGQKLQMIFIWPGDCKAPVPLARRTASHFCGHFTTIPSMCSPYWKWRFLGTLTGRPLFCFP